MNQNLKKEIFSIPNILSYIRIALIPVFMVLYLVYHEYGWAALILLLGGISDALDGYIARRFNMITELGKALDPIADKLSQASIVICLCSRFELMIPIAVIFFLKEGFMGINGLILLKHHKKLDGAEWFGKVSTAVFYSVTFLLIAIPNMPVSISDGLLLAVAFFLILSFVMYAPLFVRLHQEVHREKQQQDKK